MRSDRSNATFLRTHNFIILFLVCTLSVTTVLKIGEIQYLEILLALDIPVLLWLFARNRFRVRVFRPLFSISQTWTIFLVLAFVLALFALRQNFSAGSETLLKRPLLVTLSRMVELCIDLAYMLYMASQCRADEKLCRFGAKTYFWTAIAGCIYSLVSIPLNVALELDLGTYGLDHRMRGFDNEGGPYGAYLVSVLIVTYVIFRRGWISRRQYYVGMTFFIFCFLGSRSKAGFFLLALLLILHFIFSLTGWKRVSVISAMALLFALAAVILDVPAQIDVYEQASSKYQAASNLKSDDPNFVMGRVAGAVLAPRMIAAHPLAGIGWGNYSLVRDQPEYRQGGSWAIVPGDAPGLGFIDYMVDLGIPLWLYMTWALIKPAYLLRKSGASAHLVTMAAIHPLTVGLGTHLNLIYPWAVVALALGMGFNTWKAASEARATLTEDRHRGQDDSALFFGRTESV